MMDTILLRFNEQSDEVLPSDTSEQLEDLNILAPSTMPPVADAFTGRGRAFSADDLTGLQAVDRADGNTTLTRTMSMQAIISWDLAAQDAYGEDATLVARGKNSAVAAERKAYAIELSIINLALRVCRVRFRWEDIGGSDYQANGAWFVWPADAGDFVMLSCTRRWVSSSEVVVRYFIGSTMIGEFVETEGDIGGGTTGTTTVGARLEAGTVWGNHFCGVIDELRLVDYELAPEEIEATWLRISEYQEMGVALYIDQHPPGWPVTFDPATRSGREASLIGRALGYAAAQIENFRANMMPDRAYGRTLERWERIVAVEPRHGDSIERRRDRVLARMRQRAGVSPFGVRVALEELLATDTENIEVIAFSNIIEDDFDTLQEQRWQANPAAKWSAAGSLVVDTDDSSATFPVDWRTVLTGVDGPARIGGYGAQLFVKVDPADLVDGGEVGICLYDKVRRDALTLGVRLDGADYKVVSQRYISGVSVAETVHATTSNTPHWLHLGATPVEYSGQVATDLVDHFVRWSTTSASAGFTVGDPGDFSFIVGWCGFYARGFDGGTDIDGVGMQASFDDAKVFFPHGCRPFYFYALRDEALPGEYDLKSASATLKKLKQAHTHACAITSRDVLCDDLDSGCDLGPCGGI